MIANLRAFVLTVHGKSGMIQSSLPIVVETLMQRWTTCLTLAALLAHSVFGCCGHHAHADAASFDTAHIGHSHATADSAGGKRVGHGCAERHAGHCHSNAQGHDEHGDDEERDEDGQHHDDCDETVCQYVAAMSARSATDDAASLSHAIAPHDAAAGTLPLHATASRAGSPADSAFRAALRLHAWTQVWLL